MPRIPPLSRKHHRIAVPPPHGRGDHAEAYTPHHAPSYGRAVGLTPWQMIPECVCACVYGWWCRPKRALSRLVDPRVLNRYARTE